MFAKLNFRKLSIVAFRRAGIRGERNNLGLGHKQIDAKRSQTRSLGRSTVGYREAGFITNELYQWLDARLGSRL